MQLPRGGSRGRVQGVRTPPALEVICGFLIQLVFCKIKTMWFIGVAVGQETSAPLPKKNPGSAPRCPYIGRGVELTITPGNGQNTTLIPLPPPYQVHFPRLASKLVVGPNEVNPDNLFTFNVSDFNGYSVV